jgi:hypothetical protein
MILKGIIFLLWAALIGLGAAACSKAGDQSAETDAELWLEIEPQGCDRPLKFTILGTNTLLELCRPGYQVELGQPWLHLHDLASGDAAAVDGVRNIKNPRGATAFTLNGQPVFGVIAQPGAPAERNLASAQRLYIFSDSGDQIGQVRFAFHDDIEVLSFDVNPYAQCAIVEHRPEAPVGQPSRLTVLDLQMLQADLVGDDPVVDLRAESALTVEVSEAWIPSRPRSSWHAASGYRCIRDPVDGVAAIGGARRATGPGSSEVLSGLSYINASVEGQAIVQQVPLPPNVRLHPNGVFSTADQAIFLYRRVGGGDPPGKNTGILMFGVGGLVAVPPLGDRYEWRSFDPEAGAGIAEYFPVDPNEPTFRPPSAVGPVSWFACRPDCEIIEQGPIIRGPVNIASDGFNRSQQVLQACSVTEQADRACMQSVHILIRYPLEAAVRHE